MGAERGPSSKYDQANEYAEKNVATFRLRPFAAQHWAVGFDAGREAAMARFKALVEKAMIECQSEAGKKHGYRHIDPQEHAANVLETLLIVVAAQDRG